MLDLAEMHFYLISYYTLTETHYDKYPCVSVRIVRSKKPGASLLCSKDLDKLTVGEQLRVMRLCAGYKIEQAASEIGVGRRVVMNYELGKVKKMKAVVVERLIKLNR